MRVPLITHVVFRKLNAYKNERHVKKRARKNIKVHKQIFKKRAKKEPIYIKKEPMRIYRA